MLGWLMQSGGYTGGEMVLRQAQDDGFGQDDGSGQDGWFAEVAVNAAAPIRQTFTYRVPPGVGVLPGQSVYVPFGSRTLQGIVMEVTAEARYPEAREIEAVIDPRPLLSPERVA